MLDVSDHAEPVRVLTAGGKSGIDILRVEASHLPVQEVMGSGNGDRISGVEALQVVVFILGKKGAMFGINQHRRTSAFGSAFLFPRFQ